MNFELKYEDLGLIPYRKAWDYQEKLFGGLMKKKLAGEKSFPGHLLFCEHPPVYTLGKSGKKENLLLNEQMLERQGIEFYHINRGGDITFHGPGQIVGYPILDLEQVSIGIREYIEGLEEAVILVLSRFGIKSGRLSGATGVWLDPEIPAKARKICAIGVKASRHITMHGFAFNVNTDLSFYRYINPCGFIDKGVTSLGKEMGAMQNIEEVKGLLKNCLESTLGISISEYPNLP
ncbi:MAG TPA: lipoyl(octanoyl) transferase LipB [Bacteroidales bacterium]|nr:lipoyl(octanoyl) transferase LipB [Bacteroidales bacterium]HNQ83510.1 lipoyl(octanoyl) transferase LipB [Bacteroidales bacterium]HOX77223.1 lipoyl(octanoyl) transferase LipB [Bacteroidales bacterium]HPI87453.1 lipoyl(octanoyl) transferase LipB [Bacteroidales bacterium]HPM93712.1 lipoyl(octanoyl) transferase LipB [Bacteroidales bacterium]